MKKFLSISLLVAFVVFGAISQAAAYFETGTFAIGVYNANDPSASETLLDTGINVVSNPGALATGNYSAGTISNSIYGGTWAGLSLQAFATTALNLNTGIGDYYFASLGSTAPGAASPQLWNYENAINNIFAYHSGTSNPSSLPNPGTGGTGLNQMADDLISFNLRNDSVLDLSQLSSQAYLDMYIYHYNYNYGQDESNVYLVAGTGHDYVALLRIYSDGHMVLNPTGSPVVPIPGAVWLLGSGFLGLIGIRRRNS